MRKPRIGIMLRPTMNLVDESSLAMEEAYRCAILNSNGIPVAITPIQDVYYYQTKLSEIPKMTLEEKEMLRSELDLLDGILLPGGNKMCEQDFYALEYAIEKDIPILGICLGMQIMSCYHDKIFVEPNDEKGLDHRMIDKDYVHLVTIKKDSLLYQIIGKEELMVNSLHRYHAIENKHYQVVAYSFDGLIEALEYPKCSFHLGLQWHPERLVRIDAKEKKIFDMFIKAAIQYQKRKKTTN